MVRRVDVWVVLRAQVDRSPAANRTVLWSMYMSVPNEQLGERMIDLLPRLRRLARAMVDPTLTAAISASMSVVDDPARIRAADDLVQSCLESAMPSALPWHDAHDFENGMFALLVRTCTAGSQCSAAAADCAPRAQRQPGNVTLRSAYAALPLQQRAAIALVVLEQRSYGDAAAMLEMPLATLTQQLWQGRELLQAQLQT